MTKCDIRVVSSPENFKKVQDLFSENLVELTSIQCDCDRGVNFSQVNRCVTIFYPDQTRPECVDCVQKAKKNFAKVLFLDNSLGIEDQIRLTCAGANDCFTGETFCLVESAAKELSNNLF